MKIGAWGIGTTLVLAGAIVACGEVRVVGRALDRCDVGSGAGNGFALMVALVGLVAVHTLLAVTAVAALATSRRRPVRTTLIGLLIAVALLGWGFFTLAGLPITNELCPGGEPNWWPSSHS